MLQWKAGRTGILAQFLLHDDPRPLESPHMTPQVTGYIILGVFFLLAVIGMVMIAKRWPWSHAVIVLFLFFAGMGYSVLLGRVYKEREKWSTQAIKLETQLTQLNEENHALVYGTSDEKVLNRLEATRVDPAQGLADQFKMGLLELKRKQDILAERRGRAWTGLQPTGEVENDGSVTVRVIAPPKLDENDGIATEEQPAVQVTNLASLNKDDIVFAFEMNAGDTSALFIGEFKVVQANNKQAELVPTHWQAWNAVPEEVQFQRKQFEEAIERKGTWDIFSTMPRDSHDTFAFSDLPPEEREAKLRAMLPDETVDDFIRDGQLVSDEVDENRRSPYSKTGKLLSPQEVAELPEDQIEYRYVRPLRDYSLALTSDANSIVLVTTRTALVLEDVRLVEQSRKSAEADGKVLLAKQEALNSDVAGVQKELSIAEAYFRKVETLHKRVNERLQSTLEANSRLVQRIAAAQTEILEALPTGE